MIPVVGFGPDMDPVTPGVITDCTNLIPSDTGYKGAPTAVSVGASALAAACRGSASLSDLSGSRRLYAGTAAELYELSGSSWTNRSSATYSLGTDDRWSFIQYGNSSLAATPTKILQRSTGGAFANVSGAPTAKLIEASMGFAMALNTSVTSDTWYCSAYLDETNWTLSVANQCVTGRLVGGSGPINAARRFGDDIIAYKGGSMFVGRYVGAPEVWRWTQVSTDVGCVGQEAVVDTMVGHIFVGRDNVYLFDGTTPHPIANGVVRQWLYGDMSAAYKYKTICMWDRPTMTVWIYYPSSGSTGTIDRCIVYNVQSKKWGLAHSTIEAAVTYTTPTVTYDGGPTFTYEAGATVPYDSLYWITGQSSPAVFTSTHTLCTLSGICSSASFTTGDFGKDDAYSYCDSFQVRYSTAPLTSTATGYVKDTSGTTVSTGSSQAVSDGRHHLRQRARWHRFTVDTTGDMTLTAFEPRLKIAGLR